MTIRTLTYIHELMKEDKRSWCDLYESLCAVRETSEEEKDDCFNSKMIAINALDEFEQHDWS